MFKFIFLLFFFNSTLANEVNVFTSRHYDSDIKLYKKFTQETGIKVNILSGKGKMLEKRIIEEGENCIADVYIASDAGILGSAQSKNIFKAINSDILNENVPIIYRSDYWYGITKRARIIFYSPERVKESELKNLKYEDLSKKEWNKRIAVRQSNNVYNQSLVASLIHNIGQDETKLWLKGFVKNFSKSPQGNDRAQILSVASGEADIAIANTYYYGLMLSGQKGEEQKKAALKVKGFFPNQNGRGAHMNISGAGVLTNSPNTSNAIKFIEFLTSKVAQQHIINNTFEYPIVHGVEPSDFILKLGERFVEDTKTRVKTFFINQSLALSLMTKAGWK